DDRASGRDTGNADLPCTSAVASGGTFATAGSKRSSHKMTPNRMSLRSIPVAVVAAAALLAAAPAARARVTKIVVDTKVSPACNGATFGSAGQYETLAGRVFGELDPNDPHNTIINDLDLAPRNAKGMVEYMATFFLVK